MSRDIKLVCFDLCKTLINENSWYKLNMYMGMSPQQDEILMDWNREGLITDEDGQKILQTIYQKSGKHSYENIMKTITDFTYNEYAQEIVKYTQNSGYEVALISGSMDILVEHVANQLGIRYFGSNNLFVFDQDNFLTKIMTIEDDYRAKLWQLKAICMKLGIELSECVCVGDGDNEIEIFKATGRGVTFTGSAIEEYAWKVITSLKDLEELL